MAKKTTTLSKADDLAKEAEVARREARMAYREDSKDNISEVLRQGLFGNSCIRGSCKKDSRCVCKYGAGNMG